MTRTLSALAFSLLVMGAAYAVPVNEVCYDASIPLTTTNWSDAIQVPKFDPALGTLVDVEWHITGHVEGNASFESLDNEPADVFMNLQAEIQLSGPNGVLGVVIPVANTLDSVTAFDGVVDFGGTSGRIDVPVPVILGVHFSETSQYYYLSLIALVLTTLAVLNISRSRLGRALVSIRDNDLAAELLGVSLFGYKLRAFFIASFLAGIAGALKAHSQRGVGTEFGYGLEESIILLGMLVIGGLGTNLGPFLGVTAVVLLEDLAGLTGQKMAEWFPALQARFLTSFRPIFFGLVLMLFLIFESRGLAHRWQMIKAAWRLRPFAR